MKWPTLRTLPSMIKKRWPIAWATGKESVIRPPPSPRVVQYTRTLKVRIIHCLFLLIYATPNGLSKKWMRISCRFATGASEIGCYWIQTSSSKLHEFHLSLLGKYISPVKLARDLGVMLDPNLTFDNHITTTVLECIARLAQIDLVKPAFR